MQSSLAVLQFPLAAVPSATPDAGTAAQDFATSFAEDLQAPEGDISFADPTAIALDQPVVWVAPIISGPGGFPVGLQDFAVSDGTQGEPAGPQDSVILPEEMQLSTPAIAGGSVAIENPSNAIDFPPDGSRAETASAGADDGPYAPGTEFRDPALQPGSKRTTKSQDMPSHGAFVAGPLGSRAQGQGQEVTGPAPKPAIASEPQDAILAATPPGQTTLQAASVEAGRTADDARPRQSPSLATVPGKRMIEVLPVDQVDRATVQSGLEPATDDAPTRPTDATTTLLQEPGDVKLPDLAGDDAHLASAAADAPAKMTEVSAQGAPIPGSFWERYFTNRSDPQPASAISPDQVAQTPAQQVLTAIGIAPRPVVPKDDDVAGHFLEGSLIASEAEVAENVTVKAAAPSDGSAPSPAPDARPDPGPVLQVLPWSEATPDRVDRFDSPLSVMSSVSTPGVATGSGGPLSLPVQQVAMQLAGVLVQATDRATELALAPEELGKVRLRLEPDAANPDRLTITINVERPETLDLFRRHAGELAEAIRAAGYSGADIDFGAHGQGDSGAGQHSGPSAEPDQASDETAPIQHSPRSIAGATLDLRL